MKTQPNRYGPCHCDMTRDSGSAVYLDDDRRLGQIRMEQELRNELLHELVEKGLASDSDLALGMTNQPSRLHPESLVRHKPVPATGGSNLLGNARLMDTTVSATTDGETWDKELQLAEITLDRYVADGEEVNTGAHPFVAAELARMRAIALEAASGDSPDKAAILRATSERMRLLAKFGRLIEVAGPRSRLAEAASRAASSEEDRLGLVRSLFGSTTAVHWDPEHPADMVFDLPSAIANDPVAVLRNTGNLYGAEERRMALYAFLLQSPLVESDEPWLSGIAESHLQ